MTHETDINDITLKATPVGTDELEIQETSGGLSKKITLDSISILLLSDCEDGTFTVVAADAASGGNTGTHSGTIAKYSKRGREVFYNLELVSLNTAGMTGANDLFLRGFPFTSANGIDFFNPVGMANIAFAASANLTLLLIQNSTNALIAETISAAAIDLITVDDVTSGTGQIFSKGAFHV